MSIKKGNKIIAGAPLEPIWGAISGDIINQEDLQQALSEKISITSPAFIGTPTAPTPPSGSDDDRIATTSFVQSAIQSSGGGLPDQTGQSGKFLTTDGTDASWTTVTADSEIEWATYGTTTYQQIKNWSETGKIVCVKHSSGGIYTLSFISTVDNSMNFTCSTNSTGSFEYISLTNNNQWSFGSFSSQSTIPAGTSGNILTYTGTAGSVGSATINDIVPTQSGNTGKYLTTNGTAVSWASVPSNLPSQTGQSGKFLTTDGTDASWGTLNALQNTATGTNSLTILGTATTGTNCLNIGNSSFASGTGSVKIGNNGFASQFSTAIGYYAGAGANGSSNSIAIGYNASAGSGQNSYCIAIGNSCICQGFGSISLGSRGDILQEEGVFQVNLSKYNSGLYESHSFKLLDYTGKIPDDRLNNPIPSQSGNSGKFLTTNGTTASWATVNALPTQSGQSGKYLTTDGSNASWASVDALPSQSGQSGKFLTTDGTDASWGTLNALQNIATGYMGLSVGNIGSSGGNTVCIGNKSNDGVDSIIPNSVIIGNRITNVGGSANFGDNVIIGYFSKVTNNYTHSTVVGSGAKAQNNNASSFGSDASSSLEGVAVGYEAFADRYSSAVGARSKAFGWYAIQLGKGTNTEDSTFYVGFNGTNYKLLDGTTGKIPDGRLPIATSASSSSTNAEVVGAKLFYDTVGDIESLLATI